MYAYAILSGGGVRGAALAGCLAACEEMGIEFVGFGGTSAGAIVAYLASLGFRGREMLKTFMETANPRQLLDDQGEAFERARDVIKELFTGLGGEPTWRTAMAGWRAYRSIRSPTSPLLLSFGFYVGRAMKQRLLKVAKARGSVPSERTDVSFNDLIVAGCKPLKVCVTDLKRRVAAVYPSTQDPTLSAIDAVRASAAYPFLFTPIDRPDGTLLSDGGLSSNLPAFLFQDEQKQTGYPIIAFNLTGAGSERSPDSSLFECVAAGWNTLFEAGDRLVLSAMRRIFWIDVPCEIDATDFDVDADALDRLFEASAARTKSELRTFDFFRRHEAARELGAQAQLWNLHGAPALYETLLFGLIALVEARSSAREVRASVMLPLDSAGARRINTYFAGFRHNDLDASLILSREAGCTGHALATRSPVAADLILARDHVADWGMTKSQQEAIPTDRCSMLTVPIFAWDDKTHPGSPRHVLGTLSIDSSTPLAATNWAPGTAPAVHGLTTGNLNEIILSVMQAWADAIAKILSP